jgi:hypothetical protein
VITRPTRHTRFDAATGAPWRGPAPTGPTTVRIAVTAGKAVPA